MSAVEKANAVMQAMGWQPSVGCSCGGYWWFERGEARGVTHAEGCRHTDAPPPDLSTAYAHALAVATEIEQCWEQRNDPRYEGPWEHLGDAERDVRTLIAGLREAQARLSIAGPV